MSEKGKKAQNTFENGFNCCQAVLVTFAPELGLDSTSALRLASSFGGGVGGRGELCGAVTGAFLVLGLKYGRVSPEDSDSKAKNYNTMNEFEQKFLEKFGSTNCSELIGCDMSCMETVQKMREQGVLASKCPNFVREAADIVNDILESD